MPDGQRLTNAGAQKWLDIEETKIKNQEALMDKIVKVKIISTIINNLYLLFQKMIEDEKEESNKAISATGDASVPPKLLLAYGTMVIFRILIEVAFVYLYFHIYPFTLLMPEKYLCDRRPCNNVVACYIGFGLKFDYFFILNRLFFM